ncbi:MAG: VOC family protein [Caulobacteraceae bacterium]|nr:VOC family protein [Caulobacteraceae bacterium]
MALLLDRMAPDEAAATKLLGQEHFQVAYVTTDLDRARALLSDELGLRDYVRMSAPLPDGGVLTADFAWAGPLMYEIIHATGAGADFFQDAVLAQPSSTLAFHHLGFLVRSREQWEHLLADARSRGWAVPYLVHRVGRSVFMVKTPHLPHYLEYIAMDERALKGMRAPPRA